jgi:hypothetical protein
MLTICTVDSIHSTNTENTLVEFNSINPQIKFNNRKLNNKLNYLDITIANLHDQLTFNTFRKFTCTDLVIHNDSWNRQEHKISAIRCLTNRMNTYAIINESSERYIFFSIGSTALVGPGRFLVS